MRTSSSKDGRNGDISADDLWLHVDDAGIMRLKCPCGTVVHAWFDPQNVASSEIRELSKTHVEGPEHHDMFSAGMGVLFEVVKQFALNGSRLMCKVEPTECGWLEHIPSGETMDLVLVRLMDHYDQAHLPGGATMIKKETS